MKNADDKGRAYKVKCTSNTLFTIKGAVGYVEKGATATIPVTCKKLEGDIPDDAYHLFSIYHIPTETKETPRKTWAEFKGEPEGSTRLAIKFVRGAKEEKKDAEKVEPPKEAETDKA